MRSLISISLFFIKSKAQVCGYGFFNFLLDIQKLLCSLDGQAQATK